MVALRHFIDNASATTLNGSINSSATAVVVVSTAGYPTVPYYATIDRGTATAEQVLVTAVSGGTNLTVTRNANGLGAFSHSTGAAFEHTAVAQDYIDSNAHIIASAGVHGVTGSVVGTSDTQTLTNKTLTSPAINTPTVTSPTYSGTATGPLNVNGNITASGTGVVTAVDFVGDGILPVGGIIPFAGSAAPAGWLLCDGSAVSRTTYAALFAVIGTTYGTGDGSTTFNVPDYRDRSPLGVSGTKALASTGGAASHSHALSSSGHALITVGGSVFVKEVATTGETWTHRATATGWSLDTTGGSLSSGAALGGSSDSTTTQSPYIAANFIVKT